MRAIITCLSRFSHFAGLGLLIICMCEINRTACAQIVSVTNQTATPMPGGHDYLRYLSETVNPANGSVSVKIDLPSPAGRGITFPYSLTYNSAGIFTLFPWPNSAYLVVTQSSTLGTGGWDDSIPKLSFSFGSTCNPDAFGNCLNGVCNYITNFVFKDPTGDRQYIPMQFTDDTPNVSTCAQAGIAPYLYGNTSNLLVTAPIAPPAGQLRIADLAGTVYTFNTGSGLSTGSGITSSTASIPPFSVQDTNGNQLTTDGRTIIDTLGRKSSDYEKITITPVTVNTNYVISSKNLDTSGAQSKACSPINLNGIVKQQFQSTGAIGLPNGTSYKFEYDPVYGMLSKITYPSGGYVKYDWGINAMSDSAFYDWSILQNGGAGQGDTQPSYITGFCNESYDWPAIQHRYVSYDGSRIVLEQDFTYTTELPAANNPSPVSAATTTVLTKDLVAGTQSTTVYTYGASAPENTITGSNYSALHLSKLPYVESSVIVKDSSGHTLQSKTESWLDARHKQSETVTLDDGSTSETDYSYEDTGAVPGFVNPLRPMVTSLYDFGSGTHGTLLKKSVLTYAAFAPSNIFTKSDGSSYASVIGNRPSQVTVFDGSNAPASSTVFCYDQTGVQNVSGVVQHDDLNASSSYNVRGNLTQKLQWVSSTDSPSALISPAFCGADGLSTSILSTLYSYDVTGQMISKTDPRGYITKYSYADNYISGTPLTATNAYLTSKTEPMVNGVAHISSYGYDLMTGSVRRSIDQNSQPTDYFYTDPLNRATDVYGPPSAQNGGSRPHLRYSYNDGPSPSTTVTGPTGVVSTTYYDGVGNAVQQADHLADVSYKDTVYDGMGRVYSISNPYHTTADSTYGNTTFCYDALGRSSLVIESDGSQRTTSYAGLATTSVDEVGSSTIQVADAFGNLASVTENLLVAYTSVVSCRAGFGCTSSPQPVYSPLVTKYSYDVLGNLRLVVQSGSSSEASRTRSFNYDSLSRLTSSINPETGTISYANYDGNGNLGLKTDARGIQTTYSYDALNRNTLKTYSDGTLSASFGYDGQNQNQIPLSTGLTSSNAIGRLSSTSNQVNSSQVFSYDEMGRGIVQYYFLPSTRSFGSIVSASYDLAGGQTSLTYPDGSTIARKFDLAGRLSTVSPDGPSSTPYYKASAYLPSGAVGQASYGNGVVEYLSQNTRLQPCEHKVFLPYTAGGTMVMDKQYFYESAQGTVCQTLNNNNGNIYHLADATNSNQGSGNYTQNYRYDSLNRLSHFDTISMGGQSRSQDFGYDSFGNILSMTSNVPPQAGGFDLLQFTAQYQSGTNANRMTMDSFNCLPFAPNTRTPTGQPGNVDVYDAAGNTGCSGQYGTDARAFHWDANNLISEVWSQQSGTEYALKANYLYDATGVRIRAEQMTTSPDGSPKIQSYKEYVALGGQVLAEKDQSGAWTNYVYANGKKVAKISPTSHRLHLQGTTVQGGSELGVSLVPPPNFVVKAGDQVCWQQLASNVVGGVNIQFSNGTQTAWHEQTYEGQDYNQDFLTNRWFQRCGNLSEYTGLTIVGAGALKDVTTPPGSWDLLIADWTYIRADGTIVQQLVEGQAQSTSFGPADPRFESSFTARIEDVSTANDAVAAGTPVQQVVIRFGNDSCSACDNQPPFQDRNLYVGSITIGSTTIPSSDPSVSWAGLAYAAPGIVAGNGDLTFQLPSALTGQVSVSAWGSPDAGVYPHMEVFVNGTLAGQFDVTASPQTYSVSGSAINTGNTTHYFLADHLGTTQLEFSAGGWPVWRGEFAPFGQELDSQGTSNHYKFTGKERDTESGLDYFGARYYASSMGRWMSPDPINLTSARLENPSNTLNKYTYAANNPLKYVDRDGKDITIYYQAPASITDYGHVFLVALNQNTGAMKMLNFNAANKADPRNLTGGGEPYYAQLNDLDEDFISKTYASLTIQTTPEEANQVIAAIKSMESSGAGFGTFNNNCTTVCESVLHDLGLDTNTTSPSQYWHDIFLKHSPNAQQNPFTAFYQPSVPGHDYGSPRFGLNYTHLFYQLMLPQPQTSVTTSQQDSKDGVPIGRPR